MNQKTKPDNKEITRDLYGEYPAWRARRGKKKSARDREYNACVFSIELGRTSVTKNASIFEIGFGRGEFLSWARQSGYDISGCEIVEDYVHYAKKQGFAVTHGTAIDILDSIEKKYDLIVLFDVMEHMSESQIRELFNLMSSRLKPYGEVLARFPNCGSPFGQLIQNGDVTHCTHLTPSKIEQIIHNSELSLIASYNAARVWRVNSVRGLLKPIAYLLREMIELFISFAYYGTRVPLDPNITVVFKKTS